MSCLGWTSWVNAPALCPRLEGQDPDPGLSCYLTPFLLVTSVNKTIFLSVFMLPCLFVFEYVGIHVCISELVPRSRSQLEIGDLLFNKGKLFFKGAVIDCNLVHFFSI